MYTFAFKSIWTVKWKEINVSTCVWAPLLETTKAPETPEGIQTQMQTHIKTLHAADMLQ